MSGFEIFPEKPEKPELSVSTFDDVLEMISEMGESDESIIDMLVKMIEDEPIPDPDDTETVAAFRTKMLLINARMSELLARSDLLLELKQRVDSKFDTARPENP